MQLVFILHKTWLCAVLLTAMASWHAPLSQIGMVPRSGCLSLTVWPSLEHLIPNSDQSHNMYLECFLMKINNCHLHCWRRGCTPAAVRLTCLRNKGGTLKSNSIKASWEKSRYSTQLQISNNQAQTQSNQCGEGGLENCRKAAASLGGWRLCSKLTFRLKRIFSHNQGQSHTQQTIQDLRKKHRPSPFLRLGPGHS